MRISTTEISTFVKCPILFQQGRLIETVDKRIVNSLRKAVQYLYSYQQATGTQCSFNALIKRWNQLWWGKKRPEDEESEKLSNDAYFAMDKYYSKYIDMESMPIAVNWPYAVEIGPHVVTGTWPVVLTHDGGAQLYYPLSQKNTISLVRDIVVRADIIAMHASTGNPPLSVTHSTLHSVTKEEKEIRFDSFYPKKEWLEKALGSLLAIITAMNAGYDWGNCHACTKCVLKDRCTG